MNHEITYSTVVVTGVVASNDVMVPIFTITVDRTLYLLVDLASRLDVVKISIFVKLRLFQ